MALLPSLKWLSKILPKQIVILKVQFLMLVVASNVSRTIKESEIADAVANVIEYYLEHARALVIEIGYPPLSDAGYTEQKVKLK